MNYQYEYSNRITLEWLIKHMPQFLFPDLSKKKGRIKKPFSGVVASSNKHPVGLILSTYDQTGATARIHSCWVHPSHRGRRVGTQLFYKLEKMLKQEGCAQLDGHFRSHWPSVPIIKKLLAGQKWTEPEVDLLMVKGETSKAMRVLLNKETPLPEGYSIFPWTELTEEEKASILHKKQAEDWYPDMLNPFVYEQSINPATSIGLKYQGEVMGWLVSHLISNDTNEFTNIFVDSSHRLFKLTAILMREATLRLVESGTPNYVIAAKADNRVMSRFMLRNWEETECFITRSFYSKKEL